MSSPSRPSSPKDESMDRGASARRAMTAAACLAAVALFSAPPVPAAAPRIGARPTVRIAHPIEPAPDLSIPIFACLSYDVRMSDAQGMTDVAVEVRNTCSSRVSIDAGVDLVLRTGAGYSIVDGAHLVGKMPVVLTTSYPSGTAAEACVRLQGYWKPVDGAHAARPLADEHCP